ncbi:MAG TPA: hypothetical protein PKD05_14320, partial [Candidatus Melainabacteria bacterium]|nr:hypothetical protein [Candidatus Melainabacteria bacterium]
SGAGSSFAPDALQGGGEDSNVPMPEPVIRSLGQVDDSQGSPPSPPVRDEEQGGDEQSFNP